MKNILFPALIAAASFTHVSCAQGNTTAHTEPQSSVTATASLPLTSDSISAALKKQLNGVLNAYYAVKNALVSDNSAVAGTKAREILAALDSVDMVTFSEAQHHTYMPLAEKIRVEAGNIAEAKDLKRQREHLNLLSENVWELTKTFDVNDQPVYQQYCPMAKASWVSSEKAVKNPYYGKSMLTCGSVTKILP